MEKMNKNRKVKETKTLKEFINLARNNMLAMILIAGVTLIFSIIYAVNSRDIYKSTTTLKISKPQGSILTSSLMPEIQDFGNDRFISNEIEILKSFNVREKVARALLDTFAVNKGKEQFYLILYHDQDSIKKGTILLSASAIVGILTDRVAIEQKRGLDFADITVESPSPYEAALIANCYAGAYKRLNLEINRNQLTIVKDFLEEQRLEKQKELNQAEEVLRGYQEKGGIISLDAQAASLIKDLSDFDSKKYAAKIDLMASDKVLNQLNLELSKLNPKLADYLKNFASEGYVKSLQEQIGRLEVNRDLALANSDDKTANSKAVKEYEIKINDLKSKLSEKIDQYKTSIFATNPEEVRGISQKIIEEEVKNQSYKVVYNELEKIVNQYESKFNQLPKATIELARFQRQREALEKLYLLVEEKYQEALINEQSQPGNVLIVDYARIPSTPAKPFRLLIILVGLFLGCSIASGFVFLKNYFDNTVKTPEDILSRNINVLAWIPQIQANGTLDKNEFEFIVSKTPDSIPSEAFRALRTRIQFSKINAESLKTILITSAAPQEGKTTVCINLAISFAHTNKKTIVIDCDLRKPRVHSVFNTNRYPGLTDYLFGQATLDQIIRKSDIDNLSYITSGTIPPNPAEMLESNTMKEFFAKINSLYDIVLVDSPPIVAVTDSEIISRMVDGTIMVVSAEVTEIELMEKSVDLLISDNSTFLGAVLNNYSYRSGYGAYYKYYSYYSKEGFKKK